jgi:hypothetical protein
MSAASVLRTPLGGVSQNALTSRNGRPSSECPQVRGVVPTAGHSPFRLVALCGADERDDSSLARPDLEQPRTQTHFARAAPLSAGRSSHRTRYVWNRVPIRISRAMASATTQSTAAQRRPSSRSRDEAALVLPGVLDAMRGETRDK